MFRIRIEDSGAEMVPVPISAVSCLALVHPRRSSVQKAASDEIGA